MSENRQAVSGAVGALWQRFQSTMMARVDKVDAGVLALLEGQLDPDARRTVEREAHKLAGSLGTFGLAEGSRVAAEIERLFEGERAIESERVPELAEFCLQLRALIEAHGRALADTGEPPPDARPADDPGDGGDRKPRVFLVGVSAELRERMETDGAMYGFEFAVAADLDAAREALAQRAPDAVVLDVRVAGAQEPALAFMSHVQRSLPAVPVLALTESADFRTRLEVSAHGARALLQEPVAPRTILNTLAAWIGDGDGGRAKVLAVDDDPQMLAGICAHLAGTGVDVHTLSDPELFWDFLEQIDPDVLVLDLDMPNVSGASLCRVVRSDLRWARLPVIFLTASRDAATIERIFEAGADDYVAKPIVGPELRTRVHTRIQRSHIQQASVEIDRLTGLPSRRKTQRAIQQALSLARAGGEAFAVAAVDLDDLDELNRAAGRSHGDRVIAQLAELLSRAFPGQDLVGRDDDEFLVGIFGVDAENAVEALYEIQSRLPVRFSAGVAAFPAHGPDAAALHAMARRALHAVKADGGGRIGVAGEASNRTGIRQVDVVVVEDEEATAALIQHALETRGYEIALLGDGHAAADALAGDPPTLRARVIILDVGLPGLDGVSLLRRLVHRGVHTHSRVIMLTARASEAEIVRALDIGAFDHIAKPFSVPVLLGRVRRALET